MTGPTQEVVAAREARKVRRQLERERRAATLEARRQSVSMIRTRLVTNNGRAGETLTDRNAMDTATFSADCDTRRVRVRLDADGTLTVSFSTLRDDGWDWSDVVVDPDASPRPAARDIPYSVEGEHVGESGAG